VVSLEFLHRVRAHQDFLLLQRAFKFAPQARPPGPVEGIGHDLDDNELIMFDPARVRRTPGALGGRSGKSREAAEFPGKQEAKLAEFSLKRRASGRQEDFYDMHAKHNAKRARAFTPSMTHGLEPLERRRLPREAIALARFLIGKTLVRRLGREQLTGRIVETEVYLPDDPASHSFLGPTARNRSMYLRRGHGYVYRIYGLYWCLNISAGDEDEGAAVLLRALEPLEGIGLMQARRGQAPARDLARGPGRLCAAFEIDQTLDGADLCATGPLWLAGASRAVEIGESVRIGITRGAEARLRFFERGSIYVSGPRALNA
jgi:DNA-3-methyladenine glycosylase